MRLVYLSPTPWNSVAQRPHFFVKVALKSGFTSILWIEPTPSRIPQLKDFRTKIFSVEADSFEKPNRVEIVKLRIIPVEPFVAVYDFVNRVNISRALKIINEYCLVNEKTILVVGKPSRFALKVISDINFHRVIFDVMDDFPQFFQGISARSMEKTHCKIIEEVDLCFFSSHNLENKYSSLAKKFKLILNACDKDFQTHCESLLQDRSKAPSLSRTLGYVGSIADWFDWESVIRLAEARPKDNVVIVGPNYSKSIPRLPSNVEIRGAVQHCDIPKLLTSFDFGLIPFKRNKLTSSVDPVKYYEYVASGLHTISTYFGEMKLRINSGHAVSFTQFQNGKIPKLETPVTWGIRFEDTFKDLLNAKEY